MVSVFEHSEFDGHQRVVFANDPASGLRAIIAIHNLRCGPALGGCRIYPYASEAHALTDALRLSTAMTYKAAVAGLALGGGKSVIIADPDTDKSPELLRAMAEFVDSLQGDYLIAQDSGTQLEDLHAMQEVTPYCAASDDPAPATALGVYAGIQAAVTHHYGEDLKGMRVAVQGLGNVGFALAQHLHSAGAQLFVSDINEARLAAAVKNFGAQAVSADDIVRMDAEVFAPCALGAVINDDTINSLGASVVAGAANNQLAAPEHAAALAARGITYAPDYVINAGGLIYLHMAREAAADSEINTATTEIGATLTAIFAEGGEKAGNMLQVANALAEARFMAGPESVEIIDDHKATA